MFERPGRCVVYCLLQQAICLSGPSMDCGCDIQTKDKKLWLHGLLEPMMSPSSKGLKSNISKYLLFPWMNVPLHFHQERISETLSMAPNAGGGCATLALCATTLQSLVSFYCLHYVCCGNELQNYTETNSLTPLSALQRSNLVRCPGHYVAICPRSLPHYPTPLSHFEVKPPSSVNAKNILDDLDVSNVMTRWPLNIHFWK